MAAPDQQQGRPVVAGQLTSAEPITRVATTGSAGARLEQRSGQGCRGVVRPG